MSRKALHSSFLPVSSANLFLVIVACTAAVAIWSLVAQNRMLKAELTSQARESAPQYDLGERLPVIDLATLSGDIVSLQDATARDNASVIVFLTTTCPYCRESLPTLELIDDELAGDGASLLGISFDSVELTQEYVQQHDIGWPVYVISDAADRGQLKVRGVPTTLAVSAADGVITGVWLGVLRGCVPKFVEKRLA